MGQLFLKFWRESPVGKAIGPQERVLDEAGENLYIARHNSHPVAFIGKINDLEIPHETHFKTHSNPNPDFMSAKIGFHENHYCWTPGIGRK